MNVTMRLLHIVEQAHSVKRILEAATRVVAERMRVDAISCEAPPTAPARAGASARVTAAAATFALVNETVANVGKRVRGPAA